MLWGLGFGGEIQLKITHFVRQLIYVNCKERTTCTNSSEVEPDLCEDQDQQYSIKYKSK